MIVVYSIGSAGVIFLVIAILIRKKVDKYLRDEKLISGVLIGFQGKSDKEDKSMYPVIELNLEGVSVKLVSDMPSDRVFNEDVGKRVKVRLRSTEDSNGTHYHIVVDDGVSRGELNKMRTKLFWIFAIIGIALIVLSLLVILISQIVIKIN